MQWHKRIDTDHLLQFVYLIPYKGSWDHKCDKPLLRRLEIPISLTTWGDALFIYDEKKYCSIYIRQIKLLEYICGSITRYEFRIIVVTILGPTNMTRLSIISWMLHCKQRLFWWTSLWDYFGQLYNCSSLSQISNIIFKM